MKEKIYKKDYCSGFPEYVYYKGKKVYIGGCCKGHDNDCGQKGTKNFYNTAKDFYNCLEPKVGKGWATLITFGGTFFYGLKYPYFLYKKYKFKKKG